MRWLLPERKAQAQGKGSLGKGERVQLKKKERFM
jgi:hypothetical protein